MERKELLEKYTQEVLVRCQKMVNFSTLIVMIANPFFIILDYFMAGKNLISFIIVRALFNI